jgi:hypothetical protein
MAIIKSFSPLQNLSNYGTFITDTNPNSDYFRITEFNETFTGGKNGFLIEGSEYLKETTEIKIEILDVEGRPIYYEPGNGVPEYYEGIAKLISVHVYEDTPIGIGKITILGELKTYEDASGVIRDIPAEWSGAYNVKWERTFQINKNITNETRVRFYKRPLISIDEIVKPIYNVTTPFVTQSGSVEGISEIPIAGANLSRWTAGTLYKLKRVTGAGWTSSIDENTIELPDLGYSAKIIEVLNTDEVLVDVPYTINNIVTNFSESGYTSSFEYLDGQTFEESALTGSFAKIQISNLKTFVGDVARVKVFRKSRNDVGDYVLVQESKLESTELLRDLTATGQTDISYGNFTETTLDTYWTGSTNLLPSINLNKLYASVKPSDGQIGVQTLYTTQSVSIAKDVEYTLTFKTLYSGSVDNSKSLRAYLSSSNYTQEFLTLSGSAIYQTKQNISQNIIAIPTSSLADAKLVFEFNGSGWHVSNVSLKNAQETSFSPDEFTIVQDVAKNVASETFDFRFEFYDINNNYIPVDVFASKTFTGGNNFLSSAKLLTFDSDRNSFRFATGSIGNPIFQTIGFTVSTQNLVGPVTFGRSVFDLTGSYIDPITYTGVGAVYPGEPTNPNDNGFIAHIDEFTGSLQNIVVGSITYTASCDGLNQHETVYRLEDGDNAPGLFASSTANQFVYKATDLLLNPANQIITFDVRRKNLGVSGTPITINSGSEFGIASPLVSLFDDPSTGVATYYLSGSTFNYTSGSATYFFSASDSYDIDYHDAVKITPIKILDGFSVEASNNNTTFPANSAGLVVGGFVASSGSITVKVGNETINYSSTFVPNSFSASISATAGLTANTFNGTSYSINALSADSGSLTLLVKYKDGGGTIISSSKEITYSKAKKSAPVLSLVVGNNNQTATAKSTGEQIDAFVTASLSVIETYDGVSSTKTLVSAPTTTATNSYTIGNRTTTTIALPNMANGTDSVDIAITGSVVDSENITRNVFGNISLAKSKKSAPAITFAISPVAQTVAANSAGTLTGTIVDPVLTAFEGSSPLTYNNGTLTTSQYKITNVTGVVVASTTPATSTIDVTGISSADNTGVVTISYIDSEGTAGTSTIRFTISKAINGSDGQPGANGGDGPGVVFRGPWSSTITYNSISQDPTRKDVVLYSGTYYATKTNATANLNKQPNTETAFWQSLGTDSFFVAAEMIISKESYVQNTINVGTNGSGNANITIAGGTTSPYISIGQATKGYDQIGAFLGSNGTTGRLSLKSSTNSLLWDGTNLTVNGAGTFTGALSGGTISIGSGNSIFKADSNGIYLGNATFASAPFRVTPGGVLTASSGTIGGWTLGSTTLTGGAAILDSAGAISIGSGNSIFKADGNGIYLGNATFGSAPFRVTPGGVLTASGVNISGAITATSGTFTGTVFASAGTFTGTVTANDGTFNGTINAALGNIGGWSIGATTLTSANDAVTLDSAGKKITIKNTAGAPSVIMSQAASFSSFGGSYTNSGNHGSANATGGSTPNTQTRLIASNAITAAGAPAGSSILFTVREKTSNGTTALQVSNAVDTLILTYKWFLRNTTTGQDIQILRDSAGSYVSGTTIVYIGGFNSSSSITIAGSGHNWDLYQSTQWEYRGTGSTTASTILYPAGEWTAEQVTSFTEIIDGGIQTGNSPLRYVKLQRSAATTMIEVGGAITATDNITAYASDRRLKENIVPIDNALKRVEQLNGVHYSWKDNVKDLGFQPSNLNDTGLFAQEVQAVLPNAVKLAPFDNNDGVSISGENYLTVQYEKVVPLLVEAIKELSAEIKELKKGR